MELNQLLEDSLVVKFILRKTTHNKSAMKEGQSHDKQIQRISIYQVIDDAVTRDLRVTEVRGIASHDKRKLEIGAIPR